jgi:hypothetical protein
MKPWCLKPSERGDIMSKTVLKNRTDTPPVIESLSLDMSLMNFGADFAAVSNTPGKAVISNLTSPRECPEQMIFAVSPIGDVYKGSKIDPAYKAASKAGVKLFSQVNSIYTITDTEDSTYRVDVPLSCNLTITIPSDALITSAMVIEEFGRALHGLFETEGDLRIDRMARGSLLPTDM